MNALVPLQFDQADVRMMMLDGEPWWVGIDITRALGIVKGRQALAALDEYEKGAYIVGSLGGDQRVIIVNESGIYSLLFRSRKPIAAHFKRWLTCEVLPSIRKHGCYPPPPPQALPPPDTETPWDGRVKSLATRFREERLRWEAETGYPLDHRNSFFSAAVIRAIEDGITGTLKANRIHQLVLLGMDAAYVISGTRTLTDAERRLRDTYRAADQAQRGQLFAAAHALPQPAEGTPPARET